MLCKTFSLTGVSQDCLVLLSSWLYFLSQNVFCFFEVKMEPDSTGQNCSSVGTQEGQAAVKTEESSELGNYVIK